MGDIVSWWFYNKHQSQMKQYPIKKKLVLKETDDSSQVTSLLKWCKHWSARKDCWKIDTTKVLFNTNNIERYETADFDNKFWCLCEKEVN